MERGHVQVTRASFKGQVNDRGRFMRQFPLNLWTMNEQESAQLLAFTFFLPNPSAQLGNIEGHHHRCTQLLKNTAVLYTHTHTEKKSKKDGEASQTTDKSKWSQFKTEMGNTTCLEVAFACTAQPPATGNTSMNFTANSSAWKLSKYLLNPGAADGGLFNPWPFILSSKPWFPFCTRELRHN